jgi:hypothetical protein
MAAAPGEYETIERIAAVSPRFKARIAGMLYAFIIIAAPFAEVFVRGRLIEHGDAAATAANILAHAALYRLAGAADLITFTCDAAVALIFYELLKPVSRGLSLFAAFFRLLFVAIVTVNTLLLFAPLVFLGGAQILAAFKTEQLQALALTSLDLHGTGYNIGLVFFGFHCLLIGYLIFKSVFFPRILGALMAFAGLSWLTFLSPLLAHYLSPYNLATGVLGQGALTLWLLVMGVNIQQWKKQASVGIAL